MEKKVQTMRAGWASDPVHPNGHIYAKMALNLIEKIAAASGPQAAATGGRKRSWSSSNRDKPTRADRFGSAGGSGASGTGGGGGGRDSRRHDVYDGGNRGSGGNAGRTTSRSSDWKMRGASSAYNRTGPQQYGSGSGSSHGGGRGNSGGARGYRGGGGRGGPGNGGFGAGRGGYRY
jgi:hypothetical protein